MGFNNSNQATFVNVINGKFAIKCDQEVDGATPRTKKDGTVVYERTYSDFTGRITDVGFRVSDYGEDFSITLQDEGDKYILNMPISSGTAKSAMMALPNINFNHEVKLIVWSKVIDEKRKTRIYIHQDGETIEWFWSKDNPKELPEMKQIKVKGQLQWDDSEQIDFLREYITSNIKPKIGKSYSELSEKTAALPKEEPKPKRGEKADAEAENWNPNEKDDLPF